ncbi:transposase [Vibrio europaeus]|uniref:transposase n=1 Tax=Vibrio europaeus TaxID=300876 RepID=UPI002FF0957D
MESQKHGTDGKRRVWLKLHLAVDTSNDEIIAAELSLSNVTDAEVLPALLKQTRRKIIEISGDGAYDTRACYEAIWVKRATPLIPPREGAALWEIGHPRNIAVACQKLYAVILIGRSALAIISALFQRQECSRFKQLLGDTLALRNYNAQVEEAYAMVKALNKITGLAMPKTQRIG